MWISKSTYQEDLDRSHHNGRMSVIREHEAVAFTERERTMIDEQRRILAIQHAVEMTPTPQTLLPLAQTIENYLKGEGFPVDGDTATDAAVESDERVQAWDALARHPFFADCFGSDGSLLDAMLRKLDGLLSTESIAEDGRTHLVDTEAVEEAKGLITAYESTVNKIPEPRPVVAPGFPNKPASTDICKHCGRPIHVGDVFRDRGRKVWYHDTGFNVCLTESMDGTVAEPGDGPQGA